MQKMERIYSFYFKIVFFIILISMHNLISQLHNNIHRILELVETTVPKVLSWKGIALDSTGEYIVAVANYKNIFTSQDFGNNLIEQTSSGIFAW